MAVNQGDQATAVQAEIMDPVKENLFFESFLMKRKDRLKLKWTKYWFKLQNTTLYFYTKKDANPSCLRSQYYMHLVQSVRVVTSAEENFIFEIRLKNGKRKVLSAETAELRDIWVKILWKSMQLPAPGRYNSSCTWYDIPSMLEKAHSTSSENLQNGQTQDLVQNDKVSEPSVESTLQTSSERDKEDLNEIYNVPRDSVPVLCPQQTGPVHQCEEPDSDNSSDGSNGYDIPRSHKDLLPNKHETEIYTSMDVQSIYDFPKKMHMEKEISGPSDSAGEFKEDPNARVTQDEKRDHC